MRRVAQEPPEYNAKCGEIDCRVERVPKDWGLLDVKRDRSALKLGCVLGGSAEGQFGSSRLRFGENGEVIQLAPRVLSLAAQDARALLKARGIGVAGPRQGRVVAQTPAPGRRMGRRGIRLEVSR